MKKMKIVMRRVRKKVRKRAQRKRSLMMDSRHKRGLEKRHCPGLRFVPSAENGPVTILNMALPRASVIHEQHCACCRCEKNRLGRKYQQRYCEHLLSVFWAMLILAKQKYLTRFVVEHFAYDATVPNAKLGVWLAVC